MPNDELEKRNISINEITESPRGFSMEILSHIRKILLQLLTRSSTIRNHGLVALDQNHD